MSMKAIRDLYTLTASLLPAARTATANGTGIDLANAEENVVLVLPGAWTDGTHAFKIQDSADNSTFADAAAADQVGTFTSITSAPTAIVSKVSYIGNKRYIRIVATLSGTTTGAIYGVYVATRPRKQPAP